MIPLTVLGGYLGAGKTTIVNKLLNAERELRIAVLVNDFGAVNIDAALIQNETSGNDNSHIIELANGCVCCSVQNDLGAALESIRGARVDQVIIEASGVAVPARIADYGNTWPGYRLAGTLVAVDASNITRLRKDKFVQHLVADQLSQADLLLVTKLDLLPASEVAAVLSSLSKPYVEMPHAQLPLDLVLHRPHTADASNDAKDSGHQHFHTLSVASELTLSPTAVESLLRALPAEVVRAKGWFHDEATTAWRVECVGDRRTVAPWDIPGTAPGLEEGTRLLFIAIAGMTRPAATADLISETTGSSGLSWS